MAARWDRTGLVHRVGRRRSRGQSGPQAKYRCHSYGGKLGGLGVGKVQVHILGLSLPSQVTLGTEDAQHACAWVSLRADSERPPQTELVRQQMGNSQLRAWRTGRGHPVGANSALSQVCLPRENLKGLRQTCCFFARLRQPGAHPPE